MWPKMEWWYQTHMHGENAPWDKFPILSDVEVPRLDPHQIIEGELQNQPALRTHLRMQTFRNLWVLTTMSLSHQEEIRFSSERDRMHHLTQVIFFRFYVSWAFFKPDTDRASKPFPNERVYVVYLNRKPPNNKNIKMLKTYRGHKPLAITEKKQDEKNILLNLELHYS